MSEIFLSVVIPTFQSEYHLQTTLRAVEAATSEFSGRREIIIVDDGSADGTWRVIREWLESSARLSSATGIRLRRNTGQHSATICGLRQAVGQVVVTIDDDLQNDPFEIGSAVAKLLDSDREVLIAAYERQSKTASRKMATRAVDKLNTSLFSKPPELRLSPFRVMRLDAVQRIVETRVPEPYLTGEILMSTDKVGNFDSTHKPRISGKSTYTVAKLLALLRRVIVNYSTRPLRWIVHTCALTALFAIVVSLSVVLSALVTARQVPGWSSTVFVISLFSGLIMLALAIIAEYMAALISLINGRPQYEIEELFRTTGGEDS